MFKKLVSDALNSLVNLQGRVAVLGKRVVELMTSSLASFSQLARATMELC